MNTSDPSDYASLEAEALFSTNDTTNSTGGEHESSREVSIPLAIVLVTLILVTVLGNAAVLFAIAMEKNLQTKGNCLVLSLAVADLLVAFLVMPLGAVYEVMHEWPFGIVFCDMWTSCDVLCCTASILHLVAIAADRYWAVTDIDYVRQRQTWHVALTIMVVWLVALAVSVAPLVGWKDAQHEWRVITERKCIVSQDPGYQLFATCATFYVPLVVILLLYWKIFRVARKRIRRRPGRADSRLVSATVLASLVTEMTLISTTTSSANPHSDDFLLSREREALRKRRRCSPRSQKERKAARTLTVITGVFVVCWLPFFVMALLMPLCESCQPSNELFSFALWLGYANSMLNPIIYTVFSPDFRVGFKNVFARCKKCCCTCSS